MQGDHRQCGETQEAPDIPLARGEGGERKPSREKPSGIGDEQRRGGDQPGKRPWTSVGMVDRAGQATQGAQGDDVAVRSGRGVGVGRGYSCVRVIRADRLVAFDHVVAARNRSDVRRHLQLRLLHTTCTPDRIGVPLASRRTRAFDARRKSR